MITAVHTDPFCLTTPVRSGMLRHWLHARPGHTGMVIVPYSFRGLITAADQYIRSFIADFKEALLSHQLACLLVDLITPAEDADHQLRMDTDLHARRLYLALTEAQRERELSQPVGLAGFGARGTCCLLAAKRYPMHIRAVACIDLPPENRPLKNEIANVPVQLLEAGLGRTTTNCNQGQAYHSEMATKLASWFRLHLNTTLTTSNPTHQIPYHQHYG